MTTLRERLSDVSHDIWSSWMRWQFSVCEELPTGEMVIPATLVQRWKRQLDTPYADLSEPEKDSDREQADKILRILTADFGNAELGALVRSHLELFGDCDIFHGDDGTYFLYTINHPVHGVYFGPTPEDALRKALDEAKE